MLAAAWAVQAALLFWSQLHDAAHGLGLVAGASLLAAAGILARVTGLRERAAHLACLGGALLSCGAFLVWDAGAVPPGVDGFAQPWSRLLSLLAAGGILLALRRWTGAGDLGTFLAGLLAAGVVLAQDATGASRAQALVALLVPAALLARGRSRPAAPAALLLGSALTFFGATRQLELAGAAGALTALALGATGAWAALGALLAARRRERPLLITAAALLVLVAAAWAAIAFGEAGSAVERLRPFLNLRFLSAAGVLLLVELVRRRLPADRPRPEVAVLGALALATGYLAGLVELLALVRTWPAGWSSVTISLYTLLFAGGLLIAGFVRRQRWLRWPGLGGFSLVVLKVGLLDLRAVNTPLRVLVTGVLGLVLLLGAWAYARNQSRLSTGGEDGGRPPG